MNRIHLWSVCAAVLLLLLLAPLAVLPAAAGEPVVTLGDEEIDLAARSARAAAGRATGPAPGSIAAPALDPSDNVWFVPFVVDTGDPAGTTTLLAVRNDANVEGDAEVEVQFHDASFLLFHTVELVLSKGEVQSFNLRDQPGLPPGLARGLVRVIPEPGALIGVDYFVVTPGEDFATGGLGIDFAEEECAFWRTRILVGGAFTGGSRLTLLVNGPQGNDPEVDPPTVSGNVYDEAGELVNSFTIHTDDFVFELDAADLVTAESLFGAIELDIDASLGLGGYLIVEIGAENRYSVGFSGVCKGELPAM